MIDSFKSNISALVFLFFVLGNIKLCTDMKLYLKKSPIYK